MRMKVVKGLAGALALLALAAMATNGAFAQTKTPPKKAVTKAPATPAPAFDRALLQPATLKEKAPEVYEVKFTTTKGDFTVKVTRAWSPLGADRFYNLVKHHFYDEASFFRVVPGFVVQFGINAHPEVSRAWRNANIKDDPVKQSNKRGFFTYAMGGPNTRTTQVFISLRDNSRLDSMGFSPFGEVTEGMGIVERLYEGYGDGPPSGSGPSQDLIESQGKRYLDKGFPKLDSIKTANLVVAAGAKPASPATPPRKN